MMLLSDTTWKAIIYQQKYNICFAYEVNTRCRRWRAEQTFAHWLSQHNPAPSNTDSSASSADGPVSMNWQPCTTRTFQHPRCSWESRKQSDPEPWRHKANVKSSLTAHTYSTTPCWKIWLTHFGFLSFFFKSSAALLNQACESQQKMVCLHPIRCDVCGVVVAAAVHVLVHLIIL